MRSDIKVAIILLNYNDYAKKYLEECYTSLISQTYPTKFLKVFIVNNGANEESQRLIETIAIHARFLHSERNLGWGGGNNMAVRVALKENFDYFVMLNIDTVVERDWLRCLVDVATGHKDIQIFQSKLLLYGTNRINSLGNRIHFLGYGYCNDYGREDSEFLRFKTIDFASGATMLIKKAVFETIGLFREDYFMYYDDLEFCWRARLAGFNIGLVEQSICHHKYAFGDILSKLYYLQRNRLMTLLTLEKLATILIIFPCLIVSEFVFTIYCIIVGWGKPQWKLCRYFFRMETWKLIVERREQIKLIRSRKDSEIVKQFAGKIVFAEISNPLLRYVVNPFLWLYWIIARTLIFW